jgi:hypothetical protein
MNPLDKTIFRANLDTEPFTKNLNPVLILSILPILSKESETPNHAEQTHDEATRQNIPTAELQPIVKDGDQRRIGINSLPGRPKLPHRDQEETNLRRETTVW